MSDTALTIECFYSCFVCGLRKVSVNVPARGKEDVVPWVEQIAMPVMAADHQQRSAWCQSMSLADVMIPVTGTKRIGEAARQ